MRWFSPVIFLGAAAYVLWYNQSHVDSVLMFPFADAIFPSAKGDPQALGRVSAFLLAGVGGVLGLKSAYLELRDAKARKETLGS